MSPRRSVGGTYPPDWKDISARVREEAKWTCIRCKHKHDPFGGRTLTVHHLDMDPSNNRWWNLAALCQACHLHIQSKVIMERPWMFDHSEWFKQYAAGYYAFHAGMDDSREAVAVDVDAFLAIGRGARQYDADAPTQEAT